MFDIYGWLYKRSGYLSCVWSNMEQFERPDNKVDFQICCNYQENETCTSTINMIKKNFNNVIEYQTVKPYGDTEDICVIGNSRN